MCRVVLMMLEAFDRPQNSLPEKSNGNSLRMGAHLTRPSFGGQIHESTLCQLKHRLHIFN